MLILKTSITKGLLCQAFYILKMYFQDIYNFDCTSQNYMYANISNYMSLVKINISDMHNDMLPWTNYVNLAINLHRAFSFRYQESQFWANIIITSKTQISDICNSVITSNNFNIKYFKLITLT